MAQVQSTICDNCGKIKGESNHWFKSIHNNDPAWNKPIIFVMAFGADKEPSNDYCSPACLMTVFQKWIDSTYLTVEK